MEFVPKIKIILLFGLILTLFINASSDSVHVNDRIQDPEEIANGSRFLVGRNQYFIEDPVYSCPEGWVSNSDFNKCFRVFKTGLTWAESLNTCRDFGGDLASLHSETDFILAKSLTSQDTWIGLNDLLDEGVFVWSDSSLVDFTSWDSGEPSNSNGDQNCVKLRYSSNLAFDDDYCNEQRWFLCEKTTGGVELCPQSWILNSDSSRCLRVFDNVQPWTESLTFCRDFGGDLASLHSETDYVLAKSLLSGDAWIGLNDIMTEGRMEWSDSSPVDFTSWASGQPNDYSGVENCVEMRLEYHLEFNDYKCSAAKRILCEILTGYEEVGK